MAKQYARTFGQDLMRGEHTVGGGRVSSQKMGFPHGPTVTQNPDGTLNYRGASRDKWLEEGEGNSASGTSIFDPVLTELAYRWFCPPSGSILDPFAGGSVRGIVAAHLGYQYTGVDLRSEQIAANIEQGEQITPDNMPTWIVGDSLTDLPAGPFDFVFSCPPYADLEVYSDNPQDISTMTYADFLAVYRSIIAQAIARLKADRFACFVVGDVRDKKGFYHNFVSDTIAAFQEAGALLYNEAILVTSVGSLPIRVGKQFSSGRKLGKTHQNCLVFFNGNPKTIRDNLGEVEVTDIAEEFGEVVS
jgi:hypothetical protein